MPTYVIHAEGTRAVKIGHSSQPKRRLQELKIGSPVPLRMICVVPEAEQAVQDRFRGAHLHGEWYEVTPEMIDWVEEQGHDFAALLLSVAAQNDDRAVLVSQLVEARNHARRLGVRVREQEGRIAALELQLRAAEMPRGDDITVLRNHRDRVAFYLKRGKLPFDAVKAALCGETIPREDFRKLLAYAHRRQRALTQASG